MFSVRHRTHPALGFELPREVERGLKTSRASDFTHRLGGEFRQARYLTQTQLEHG
ncbi:MAG: hypothetical protein ABI465_19560 [Ktedonobacteraceae bacterium]